MRYKGLFLFFIIFCLLSCMHKFYSTTIGSNVASSRQFKTFFPSSHIDNKMIGFTVFENGLTLEDSKTTCTFDAFFPISGDISLNGGSFYLAKDTVFKSPFKIGSGNIVGACSWRSLMFPGNVSYLNLPSENHSKILLLADEVDIGQKVNAIDWSFDNNYLAVVSNGSEGTCELGIYHWNNLELTLTASVDFNTKDVHAVKWHPFDYYLAIGKSGADELKTFYFDTAESSLIEKDGKDVGKVYSIAWHATGNHLSVGRYKNNELTVYDVAEGMLGDSYSCLLYTSTYDVDVTVQKHGMDWSTTGTHVVVGISLSDAFSKDWSAIKVFAFDGDSLSESSCVELPDKGCSVSWMPDMPCIAAGFYSGEERFRVYSFFPGMLLEKACARIDERKKVNDIEFNSTGVFVAEVINNTSTSHELRIFSPDCITQSLNLVAGYKSNSTLKSIAWSGDDCHIAIGDSIGGLYILKFVEQPLIFKDLKLFFNSDVIFRGKVIFEGNCTVNGGGNVFEFGQGGAIVVGSDSSLIMEDMKIKGIDADVISCVGDTSSIKLREVVWVQDGSYTFSVGSLQFENDILMAGDYTFAYQTKMTSTLLSKSTLTLDAGFTFSYDPIHIDSKKLFEMADCSSHLILNGATLHSTVTGMQLENGKLKVMRDSYLSSEIKTIIDEYENEVVIDKGITFGDSIFSDDLLCEVFSGVVLRVIRGSLNYKNVLEPSWKMHNITSVLQIEEGARLNVYENLHLGNGNIVFGNNAIFGKALGKDIVGSLNPQGLLLYANI